MPFASLYLNDRDEATHDVRPDGIPTLRVRMGDFSLAVDEYALEAGRQLSAHLVQGIAELERVLAARSAKTAVALTTDHLTPPSATQVVGLPADAEVG